MLTFAQSPTDPAFVQDPYAFYDRARQGGDLFHWLDGGSGYNKVCAVTHRAVSLILRDRRFGREVPAGQVAPIPAHLVPFYAVEAHSMLELEPPRHTRLRGLVLRAFTSRRIAGLGPEIETLSHDLIDRFPSGTFDLLDAFARRLPVIIICRLLGVPEDRADDLLAWSNAMVAMYQARRTRAREDAASAATLAFREFLTGTIRDKRKRPGDDLVSELIAAEDSGERLSADELVSTCMLLLNAGHEATVHTLGNGVKCLIENDCRTTDAATIEEVIRYDPPLHMFTRWAYEDVPLFGETILAGTEVSCLLGGANRDPAVYGNPNRFDPARKGPANTSFGGGIHFCVGAPLARLELLIALRALFARFPALAITTLPTYANVYHFHGLDRLMVRI